MNKAVFFDRDGVINQLALNKKTGEYESPHSPDELKIMPGALDALKRAMDAGYLLFVVSNQPSYAKGKASLDDIKLVHEKLHAVFVQHGIRFTQYYYCYHHPDGVVPEYSGLCDCRKPGQKNMDHAKISYDLDMSKSWFVGDQDMDIECGKKAGTKTVLIQNKLSSGKRGGSEPDHITNNIVEAVDIIMKNTDDRTQEER